MKVFGFKNKIKNNIEEMYLSRNYLLKASAYILNV